MSRVNFKDLLPVVLRSSCASTPFSLWFMYVLRYLLKYKYFFYSNVQGFDPSLVHWSVLKHVEIVLEVHWSKCFLLRANYAPDKNVHILT